MNIQVWLVIYIEHIDHCGLEVEELLDLTTPMRYHQQHDGFIVLL